MLHRSSSAALLTALSLSLLLVACDDGPAPVDGMVPTDGGVSDGEVPPPDGGDDGGMPPSDLFTPPVITTCPGDSLPPPSSGRCEVTAGDENILLTGDVLAPGDSGTLVRTAPDRVGDEMMQLVIADRPVPRRHRLHTLAGALADQTRNIGRTHPPLRFVLKRRNKRCQPTFQIVTPGSHKPPASLNAGSL